MASAAAAVPDKNAWGPATGIVRTEFPKDLPAPFPLEDNQKKLLDQFVDRFKDQPQEFPVYLRFLSARNWDLDAAEKQLREALKFREENKVDTVLERLAPQSSLVKDLVPHLYGSFDKLGRPIYIERTGKIDVARLMNLVTKENLMANHLWGQEYQIERCRQQSKKLGKLVYQTCNISDLSGMTMAHQKAMKFLQDLTVVDQAHYPELMGNIYIVNAPWIFGVLWKVVKHWIDPKSRQKIHVLSANFKQELLELVGPNLPEEYGGTMTDVVPIPNNDHINLDAYDPELTETSIAAGADFEVDVEVKNSATVSWFYRTIKHDISFSVTFVSSAKPEEKHVVVPPQKNDSSVARVQGSWTAEEAGRVILKWDNTYSWLNAKTLRYNVNVDDSE